jgi:hypothetical protein
MSQRRKFCWFSLGISFPNRNGTQVYTHFARSQPAGHPSIHRRPHLLSTEQKVQEVPLKGYWKLNT